MLEDVNLIKRSYGHRQMHLAKGRISDRILHLQPWLWMTFSCRMKESIDAGWILKIPPHEIVKLTSPLLVSFQNKSIC